MNLLFLGGTQFVGRHMVAVALDAGHSVTLFNRGRTNPGLFADVEQLRGDRDGDLEALRERHWDAVFDVNAYIPRHVRLTAELLRHRIDRYVFISTVAVYDLETIGPNCTESGALRRLDDPTTEEVTGETYGPLKVLCEQVADEILPGRVLHLRPGIVAGPYDPTDRVTYYAVRAARGGRMAVPGEPDRPVQFIDARDLARFAVTAVERGLHGIYNVAGHSQTRAAFIDACATVADSVVEPVWIDDAPRGRRLLEDQELPAGGPLPIAPPPELDNVFRISAARALRDGLAIRPVVDSLRAIRAWDAERPVDEPRQAGMTAAQEALLLERWAA
jgi:2'-hydroxyisoflavone reductase